MKSFLTFLVLVLVNQASAQTLSPLTQAGPTSQRPRNGGSGVYYDTDLNAPIYWDGRSWNPGSANGLNVLGRSQSVRAADVINVLDSPSGVVCDGVTDNANALNNNLSPLLGPGKVAYFPPAAAKCLTSQPWFVPDGTTVKAEPGSVFLAPTTGNTQTTLLMGVTNPTSVLVYGLGFDGGGATFANNAPLVIVYNSLPGGSKGAVFDNIAVQHTRGIGVEFSNGLSLSGVRNSRFIDVGNRWKSTISGGVGVAADRSAGIVFCCGTVALNNGNFADENTFTDIGLDSVSFTDQTLFSARGNRMPLASNQDIIASMPDYPAGLYGANSVSATLTGNVVSGAPGNGIDVITTTGLNISGNSLVGNGGNGIAVGPGTHVVISGNHTLNNSQGWAAAKARNPGGDPQYRTAGILLIPIGGTLTDVAISGNDTSDTQTTPTQNYGISAFTGSSLSDIQISPNNVAAGNVYSAFGGMLNGAGLSYAQVPHSGIIAGATGSGSILASPQPDNAALLMTANSNSDNVVSLQNQTSNKNGQDAIRFVAPDSQGGCERGAIGYGNLRDGTTAGPADGFTQHVFAEIGDICPPGDAKGTSFSVINTHVTGAGAVASNSYLLGGYSMFEAHEDGTFDTRMPTSAGLLTSSHIDSNAIFTTPAISDTTNRGAALTSYTPTLTPAGGTGVAASIVAAVYERHGKILYLRVAAHITSTTTPSNMSFTLPNSYVTNGTCALIGSNVSTGALLFAGNNTSNSMILFGSGANVVTGTDQYVSVNGTCDIQ